MFCQVDLQKSLRTLESKESELRRSKASLREKEAQLEVSGWQCSLPCTQVLCFLRAVVMNFFMQNRRIIN